MFSWDIRKAISNFEKHGVSLEETATSFDDQTGLAVPDLEHSTVEERRQRVAMSESGRVLLTVYTVRRLKSGKETTRIISARQASRRERQAYYG
ncbi:MAG: BrnT family toxin [Acidobacteria bacterium]|nr:BrnT family toxin [Acidobacteriota bacterium]